MPDKAAIGNRALALGFDAVGFAPVATPTLLGADALVLATEWNEFRSLSPEKLATAMRGRVVVDLRNVFDPAAMRAAGLDYTSIGRPYR